MANGTPGGKSRDKDDAVGRCTLVIREDDRLQRREAERATMRDALARQIAEKEKRRQVEVQAEAETRKRLAAEAEALKEMERRRRERLKQEQLEHKTRLEEQIREKAQRRSHKSTMSAVEKKINTRLLEIAKSQLTEAEKAGVPNTAVL